MTRPAVSFPSKQRWALALSLASRFSSCLLVLAGALLVLPYFAQAQDNGSPPLQPFQPATASPTPKVRRALPVTPSAASEVTPPVARAVPVDPAVEKVSPTPASRNRRTAVAAAATPIPAKKTYPAPGSDAPSEPTPAMSASRDDDITIAHPSSTPASHDDDITFARPSPVPGSAASPTARPSVQGAASAAPSTAAATLSQRKDAAPKRPRPGGTPTPAPAVPDASPSATGGGNPAMGNADGADDIRIAPQSPGGPAMSPDDRQINLANDLFKHEQFAQAAAEYERYLGQYPDGPQRQAAYWWLGECYRRLGRVAAARSSYQNLLVAYKEGEFVGPASFRLAVVNFEDKDYQTALPLFQRSATMAKSDDVRLSSRYFEALCLEQLDRRDETMEVYEEVLGVTANNPYRDDARLALGRLAIAQKHPNEALKQFEALSREATKPALQAESALKAGLIAKELGQLDTATTLLTRAFTLPAASAAVRADAQIAQLHLLYDANKYQRLLDSYNAAKNSLPENIQAEAMLMAGNSMRQLGRHTDAQAVYDEILTQFPKSPQVPEARYQRIISLYASNGANFVHEADDFLTVNNDPVKGDQVRLMKADSLFTRKDYPSAAVAYAALDNAANLPAKYKAEAAYRLGYCYAQAKQPEKTADAFTRFIKAYPAHPFIPKALVQRAVAYQQLKNYQSALQDFNSIIDDYRQAKEREIALQQKALILGQQDNERGMADTFRLLVKEYPKSEAAGLAYFYIGRSLFNAKDYTGALAAYQSARKADPQEYGPRASLPVILCEFQLQEKANLATEIDAYQKAKTQPAVPAEILRWLGEQYLDDKDYAAAEPLLAQAAASPTNKSPDTWLILARTRLKLSHWDGALEASRHYLETVSAEPSVRAQGLLAQGDALLGLKQFDEAQKSADETLLLQPEGSLNAKARLLGGRILYARGDYEQASKAFMSVSVLYDDAEITPQALRMAADALEKAGKPTEAAKVGEELKSRFPGQVAAKQSEG